MTKSMGMRMIAGVVAAALGSACGSKATEEPAGTAGAAGSAGSGGAAGAGGGAGAPAGCGDCEIANLDGECVPRLPDCAYDGPYIGWYGDDPGVFDPVDSARGVYLDGGKWEVPAGSERTQCTYVLLDQEIVLGRYEARMNPHSHHFNMLRYDPALLEAQGVQYGVPRDCVLGGLPYYVAGSEWQYVDAPLPAGLGVRIPAGVVLELQSHYINTTSAPLEGRVEVNLYSRKPAEVEHYAGVYFNIMKAFSVDPGSTARWKARCPATDGTSVVMLTSHNHRFGQRFTIDLYDDGAATTTPLYESAVYDHPLIQQRAFDPLVIGPQQGFEWSCEFENSTTSSVKEGEMGLTDEMCIMIAYYYDEIPDLPFCLKNGELVP